MEAVLVAMVLLSVATTAAAVHFFRKHRQLAQEQSGLVERFRGVVDADVERQRVLQQIEAERVERLRGAAEVRRARRGVKPTVIRILQAALRLHVVGPLPSQA